MNFNEAITAFSCDENNNSLRGIGRGIEREALRVLPQGRLAETAHHNALGSALTHDNITTDYSETLLEFITPVSQSAEESLQQLRDVQKYTYSHIGEELLWPMSMPCFVDDDNKIELANYGSSNVGRMKTVYRQGLKNRYGSMMQVIAGIHFNFSFSKDFWLTLKKLENNTDELQDYISDKYFALLRNYKRYCWLIPYLYGSSPAICPSFLQGKETALPFKKSSNGYAYLPFATSLRMSDLGYTNSEQSSLHICYNNLSGYVDGVKDAISLPSAKFEEIGIKVGDKYRQLNSNVLQIENELYAPVRPKQVTQSGEKPSEALLARGVEYIEVRALDVNPFSDTGINLEQIKFLDVFLTYCVLNESEFLNCEQQSSFEKNMDLVVVDGRNPELLLDDGGVKKSISQWGNELFEGFSKTAKLLDKAYNTNTYTEVISSELNKVDNPELTPSAQLLELIVNQELKLTEFALKQAESFKSSALSQPFQFYDLAYFETLAKDSHHKQLLLEQQDSLSFDDFLVDYFS